MSGDADLARAMFPNMPGDQPAPAQPVARPAPKPQPQPEPQREAPKREAAADPRALFPDMPGDKPAPPPRRVAARAKAAVSEAERLYPDMPSDQDSPATDAGAAEEAAPAQEGDDGDAGGEAQPEAIEVLEILPGLTVEAPEGFEEYNTAALDAFAPIVERSNLSVSDAQELVNIHAAAIAQTIEDVHAQNLREIDEIQRGWRDYARRDPELLQGGFEKNINAAKEVLRQFAPPELREVIKVYGLGDHPALLQFLVRTHAAIHKGLRRRYDAESGKARNAAQSGYEAQQKRNHEAQQKLKKR